MSCRRECFRDRHLFSVLLPCTKLVYLNVVFLDLSANILSSIFRQQNDLDFF